ncbi:MAG TPA: glycoside hydrolase family 3 C-terminal domain-containing protein [Verrucomicrobiae bacterium]|nr:glycoside hydrolase family 3 C-terminal domain-containing protein [Verrucomicrobiae bacterium]
MNTSKASNIILLALTVTIFNVRADEICNSCEQRVEVIGQTSHFGIDGNQTVQGAGGNEVAFHEEIWGEDFKIVVPHLPAGKYTVILGESENFFTEPGQRVFSIAIDGKTVATNLDIFAAAGGTKKALYLTNTVDHADDSVHGPLIISFTSIVNNGKFNTLEIKNAAGLSFVSTKASDMASALPVTDSNAPKTDRPEIWKDSSQPIDARVNDLISRMSLAEKVQQIRNDTPAIPRLGIPAYDFWNEALHGVGRAGIATVFPQAIGMAATWDTNLIHQEGDVISTEARAKHNDYVQKHNGDSAQYYGLTFWSPNINIFRDPRWGRGQETYGEDPFLTGTIGVAFIHGLQGDDPNYIKAMACAKHFAVHSGPESKRHTINVDPSERDFYETYLPHFEMAVREGHVGGVMGAYNSVYGQPANASPLLLTRILRDQWGFDGYVVSDCGAINDIYANHKFMSTPEEAASVAVQAGCDICCGGDYNALLKAVGEKLITEKEIDGALAYALKTRFRLGLFDPADKVPFSKISIAENDTPEHVALALKAARESVVLLKNDGALPLDRKKIKRLAVIGTNANSVLMLLGNYNGKPSHPITILNGIRQTAGTNIEVIYDSGCPLALRKDNSNQPNEKALADTIALAKSADVVIYVGGISPQLEGEEMSEANGFAGFSGGDRTRIELPSVQDDLLKQLQATGKPVVFVNCSGSAIAMPWEAKHLSAIVQAWYPGEEGGRAVAEVLFGDVNPTGRLPITFYNSTQDLPDFDDYSMSNRTYRYFSGQPEFAFGHGLSYTKFNYSKAKLDNSSFNATNTITLTFNLKNTGKFDGDEVAQVYFRHVNSAVPQPKLALCGFARVHLAKGDATQVTVKIPAERLRYWDVNQKQYVVEPGNYQLLVSAASDDIRLKASFKIAAD